MSTSKTQGKKQCTRHIFSLKPKSNSCYYQNTITLPICDKEKNKPKSEKSKVGSCFEGPTFNKDRNYLTSSFIVSSQKVPMAQNQKKYPPTQPTDAQPNKYKNFQEEKTELVHPSSYSQLIAKPNSKNMYCNVCKEKYQDYLEVKYQTYPQHIGLPKHKKKIEMSSFTLYIREFQEIYKDKRVAAKDREMATEASNNIIVIDESQEVQSIQELSRPSKRLKLAKNVKCENGEEEIKMLEKNKQILEVQQYQQIFDRLRASYWQLLQMNSMYPMPPNLLFPYNLNLQSYLSQFSQVPLNPNYPYIMPYSGHSPLQVYPQLNQEYHQRDHSVNMYGVGQK